jgi:hypothetical protein
MNNNNNNKDTLTIKTIAKKDIVYHYSREERLAMLQKKSGAGPGKGLFRNKILLLIVCDIILIILIYYFVYNFIAKNEAPPDTATTDIAGYHIRLHGYRIKDKVFARLYIEKIEDTEKESEEKSVSVQFSIETGSPARLNTYQDSAPGNTTPKNNNRDSTMVSTPQRTLMPNSNFRGAPQRTLMPNSNFNSAVQYKEKLPGTAGEEIKIQATLISGDESNELSARVIIGDINETLRILPRER